MLTDCAILINTSKYLSYILRHAPEAAGIQLDSEGWADIDALITGSIRNGHLLDKDTIEAVVSSNDKRRFLLSEDGKRIRAAQGHSASFVNPTYPQCEPPQTLFHGTATRFISSIFDEGLKPGARHYVHLSSDLTAAKEIGQRYGKAVVVRVDTQSMHRQGFSFYLAENGVWLTKHVPREFLSIASDPIL
jgi:putative RNA 2'-phosphotransferase